MRTAQVILLVEDNDDDAELTEMAFGQARVTNPIVRVKDGFEALEYLYRTGPYADRPEGLPAVVLLDLNLPKLSGLEVLSKIREDPATRRLPVVILTTSAEEQDRATAYDRFVNSYVRKPVDYNAFVQAAEVLGLYWTVTNLPPPGSP